MLEIMSEMLHKQDKEAESEHGSAVEKLEECVADGCALSLLYNKVN